jgi:Kef-type K+ transport system membrane component KefB
MTPEQIEQVIDMLAEKLGPMAQVVWEAYLRQAALSSMRASFITAVLAILTLTCAIALGAFLYGVKVPEKDKGDHAFWGWCAAVDSLFFVAFLFTAIHIGIDAYMRIHNPAYYAIQMLLGR